MKFAATLIAAVFANESPADGVKANCETDPDIKTCWESYFHMSYNNVTGLVEVDADSMTGSCGMQYIPANSILPNRTYDITYSSQPDYLAFGDGAFVTPDGKLTGFDGVSGVVNGIATWNTAGPAQAWYDANTNGAGELAVDNTTRFDHEDCFTTDVNRWISVSEATDHGAPLEDAMFMMVDSKKDVPSNFAIANYGELGNAVSVSLGVSCDTNSISSHMGTVTPGSDTDCSFSIEVTDDQAQLLYFTATTNEPVDFFVATVTA